LFSEKLPHVWLNSSSILITQTNKQKDFASSTVKQNYNKLTYFEHLKKYTMFFLQAKYQHSEEATKDMSLFLKKLIGLLNRITVI